MKHIFLTLAILSVLSVFSCSTSHNATQLVHHIRADTVYMKDVQYDSIYIYKDRSLDYRKGIIDKSSLISVSGVDTVFVKDVSIEYRYRLLRDTIRLVQHDSIPYEVTITETREITRPLTWFDHLTRACFWVIIGAMVFYILRLIRIRL